MIDIIRKQISLTHPYRSEARDTVICQLVRL